MLMPQTYLSNSRPSPSCVAHIFQKTCLHGTSYYPSFQVGSRPWFQNKRSEKRARNGCNNSSNKIKAVAVSEQADKRTVKVKATITVQQTVGGFFSELGLERGADDITDLLGKSLLLELVSTTLNPKTKTEKETIKGSSHRTYQLGDKVKYEAEYEVPHSFGEIGAIFVENEHHKEMFITDVVFEGFPTGPFHISCNSWVHSKFDNPVKRVFFSNKVPHYHSIP